MKSKWTKFLTFKRIVFLSIVLVVGIVLLTYFVGGYKGIVPTYNTKAFTLDGFVSYVDLETPLKAEAEELANSVPYDKNDEYEVKLSKCLYNDQVGVVENELSSIVAKLDKQIAELKKDEVANAEAISKLQLERDGYYQLKKEATKLKGKIGTREEFIKKYVETKLGYGEKPLMENASYEFYFDKKWTTFKIVEKATGNEWYSNPQDENATSQQKSPVNIYYAGALGGTVMWDSYTYAISDANELTPNFQIKEVKDSNGKVTSLQVYYYLEQRGISYLVFPKFISGTKICSNEDLDLSNPETLPELILRNYENTTDGKWEEVVSLSSATDEHAVTAEDKTTWYAGNGAPSDSEGINGAYYVDLDSSTIYIKTTKAPASERDGVSFETVEAYWQEITAKNLTWKKYVESNDTYNNLFYNAPVYKYGYAGNGAPLAEEGLNGFYYYDANSNTIYKKSGGTSDYSYVLAAKEISFWTVEYYGKEAAESESNQYGYDFYAIKSYEGMGLGVRQKLYTYYYQKCAYTEDDLISDNGEFGVETVSTKGEFGVAIEYALTENGLSATLLDNSIYELEDFPLTTIEVLPYFTSAHQSKEGYMLIPDGSGAIMNFNNGKTKYVQYAKSVYTTDLSKMDEIKQTETKNLMFPMYAMVNTMIPENDYQSGVLADAVTGTSQIRVSANVSGITDEFNKIFFSVFYRESQKTTIGGGYKKQERTKWTEERVHNDVTINYNFLGQNEMDYSSIAKKYRNILIDRYGLEEKDTTDETVLNVSLIGAYDFRNNFLGVAYRDYDAMTTFEQAEEILADLKAHGANRINAYYLGWRKKGLINTTFKDMDYSNVLGSKKDLESLVNYSNNNNVELYMDVNFSEFNDFQESYGKSRYSSRDVSGAYVEKYPYDLSNNVYDKNQRATYVLSPRYYQVFMQNLAGNYQDSTGLNNLSIKNLGSALASDYKRHGEIFKQTALEESVGALKYATENGIDNITLYNPYDFAFKYTSNALEVPYEATQYEIFNYSIPFYQLVVNGLFDYSGEVINATDEKGTMWHIMHILETGSNISFTFSYEDSSKLIQTDYKNYYYTQYSKWTEDVAEILDIIDEIGIHGGELTSHERIANNVYKVTYTGKANVEVILNYGDASVDVNGVTIAAKSYVYNKNNSGWRE